MSCAVTTSKSSTIAYEKPFKHHIIDNFLDPISFNQLYCCYKELEFHHKCTDLFEFYQTDELAHFQKLDFFKQKLLLLAKQLEFEINDKIDMFASYYAKNNFLLPHDDLISTRKYAYSLYLDDYESGELTLFNNQCDRVEKRIEIKKNRLVIFEVSEDSWHEVSECKKDGRKAFTGWYHSDQTFSSKNLVSNSLIRGEKNLNLGGHNIDLEVCSEKDIISFEGYIFDICNKTLTEQGPFCDRKVMKIIGSDIHFNLSDSVFVGKESILIRKGDYILLNDVINDEYPFLFYMIIIFKVLDDNLKTPLHFVNSEGEIEFDLIPQNNIIYVIKGGIWKWFIPRSLSNFYFEYFIYKINKT